MSIQRPLAAILTACALLSASSTRAQSVPDQFAVEVVHARPGVKSVGLAFLPDERILVIGVQSGEVRLLVDGVMKEDPIGTIPELNLERNNGFGTAPERGLLGIAIDPDWPEEPFTYLFYSHTSGYNRVSRFRVEGAVNDPASEDLTLDLSSEQILLALKDDSEYHNAGTLRFGSDTTLYVSHGDDENWKEDDEEYLQDLTNLYGKILRINRDGSAPDDNPTFREEPGGRLPEIFAIGLRNPFRFAIDPHTDRLFIGDVGSDIQEEFNLSEGGENFGYSRHEGDTYFNADFPISEPSPTAPIHSYASRPDAHAGIALATYRPKNYPYDRSFPEAFDGVHFYADYFSSTLRYLRSDGLGGWEPVVFGSGFDRLTDAAIGPDGSLYLISYNGALSKIVYEHPNVAAEEVARAANFDLRPNHPNPFYGNTTITYHLGMAENVRLDVYDVLGRRVAALIDAWQPAGVHTARLEGGDLAPGTYFYRLRAGEKTDVRTMVRAGR